MIFKQTWQGVRIPVAGEREVFAASVPGNIQLDYAKAKGFPDVMYGENCALFEPLENDAWEYCALLDFSLRAGERAYLTCGGIDYKFDILLDGNLLLSDEGMFHRVEIDLTDKAKPGSRLTIHIYPHPKRKGAFERTRDEADASCKPPVCYGWDWNPRLLISGLWQDAYIETRTKDTIRSAEARYTLAKDFSSATVDFDIDCDAPCTVELFDREGKKIYTGDGRQVTIKDPHLWWCNGQGEAYLYSYVVKSATDEKRGKIGFRRVRLLRNPGAHDPHGFPKSRYDAPITLELNGRRIFLKGSNWVNPELFWGEITKATYEPLLDLAKDANMNILRMWGGAGFAKDSFYDLCDEKGLLVWQEFMLACNAYPNEDGYLAVLEKEARAMIPRLRSHACLAMWCGGNELFNGWSGMTDQSLPLRLLNKLCYELDRDHPFLMTSPLTGMGHGGYRFFDVRYGTDVFQSFQAANCTAYTEFGVPSIAPMEELKKIIPPEDIGEIREIPSWKLHHAIRAWMPSSHACTDILEKYFGKANSVAEQIAQSDILQCEGLKAIFEEARRQKPHCSAALNWCFNEPWITAANCSIVGYPALPKPGYYAVKASLRPTLFSARVSRFDWKSGEKFKAQIWMLNDSPEAQKSSVEVLLKIGDQTYKLLSWQDAEAPANENTEGCEVCLVLPEVDTDHFTLLLQSKDGTFDSEYCFAYTKVRKVAAPKGMNM